MKFLNTNALFFILIFFSINNFGQIKRVIVEESTGTWCGSCGFGGIYFDYLEENYPNAIPVAVHTGPGGQDPMAIFNIELYMIPYFSGSPTFLFDRKDFPENPSSKPAISASNPWSNGLDVLDSYMDQIYNETPIATIGVDQNYNSSTREISVTITSNFIENVTGDFRLNCFILEDSVTGGTEYDQANSNFSGWTDGPAFLQELIDESPVIVGYEHNHVLRAALGNPEGATASIPTNVSLGSSYSKTFTYTLPAEFDENNITLIGMLQRYGADVVNDREIENANSQHLNTGTASTLELSQSFIEISIYPNPITENSSIEIYVRNSDKITCELMNLNGQRVKELFNQHFTQGEYLIDLKINNLANGMYYLKFTNSETSTVKKIVVSK